MDLRRFGPQVVIFVFGKGKLFVTVPYHAGKTIPTGTLRSIIRQAELTPEQFLSKR